MKTERQTKPSRIIPPTARTFLAALALFAWNCRGQEVIDAHVVAGGGGTSSGGSFRLSGTIGQPEAHAPLVGGNYSLTGGFWSITVIPTPDAPILFIARSGPNAILSWAATAPEFVLEHSSDLSSNSWSAVPEIPAAMDGFFSVTNVLAPGGHFYRLRHP